jgi:hypothetical protein
VLHASRRRHAPTCAALAVVATLRPYTGGGDKEEVAMLVAGGLYIGVEQLVRP